ncbi:hypothetical protein H7H37_08015, partial [Mycolicibacterium insubricum]|nr:hypothetical protein [Mycolicibacterium insubricum]
MGDLGGPGQQQQVPSTVPSSNRPSARRAIAVKSVFAWPSMSMRVTVPARRSTVR